MKHVDRIIDALKAHGITIQRYDALSTNSVYLKLDYGVLKSLRISDHHGKAKLNYRYNLLSNLTQSKYDKKNKRFFFPTTEIDKLLAQIISDHTDRKARYGSQYKVYMAENIKDNGHKKGFWSESHLV